MTDDTPQARYLRRQRAMFASISFLLPHTLRNAMDNDAAARGETRQAWLTTAVEDRLRPHRATPKGVAGITLAAMIGLGLAVSQDAPAPHVPSPGTLQIASEDTQQSLDLAYTPGMHAHLRISHTAMSFLDTDPSIVDDRPTCLTHDEMDIMVRTAHTIEVQRTQYPCHGATMVLFHGTLPSITSSTTRISGTSPDGPWAIYIRATP